MDHSSESRAIPHGGSQILFWKIQAPETDTIKYLNNKGARVGGGGTMLQAGMLRVRFPMR
jgi:hypothetical protein